MYYFREAGALNAFRLRLYEDPCDSNNRSLIDSLHIALGLALKRAPLPGGGNTLSRL
jgi:hypothetical protein